MPINHDIILQITILGSLTIATGPVPAKLPASRKTRALLAYLLRADHPQRREHLVDLLWDEGPDDPRAALRWSLSKLRPVLNDDRQRLIADREVVSIDPKSVSSDLDRAETALNADVPVATDMVSALTSLRKPLFAGLDLPRHERFAVWLAAERAAAERLRRSLLHRYVTSIVLEPEERLPWMREWLDVDPFNVDAAAELQSTLLQMGRQSDASVAKRCFADATSDAGLPPPPPIPIESIRASPGSDQDMLQRQKVQFCCADDGVRLAYAHVGVGPPLVKAANWFNHLELDWDAPIWAPIFQELARDHTFVRYDERGNGMSDQQVEEISFGSFVRDLETVVDAAGIERFPLLGLSQGCAIAIEYAVRHPERVSHLILWGGYATGWRVGATDDLIEEREAIITLVRNGWGRNDPTYRQLVAATLLPSATIDELNWFDDFQRQTVTSENAARYMEVFADIDVQALLRDVRAPTLVMHARGDRHVPLAAGGELAAKIQGAEFVTLNSDNHMLLGREPASIAFVAHIQHFLSTPDTVRVS